jgi:PAS domain S-box-containing protein
VAIPGERTVVKANPDLNTLQSKNNQIPHDIMDSFFAFFPDPLLIWSSQGIPVKMNRAAEEFLEYTHEELIKEVLAGTITLFGSEAAYRLPDLLREEYNTGRITVEIPLRKKSGGTVLAEIRSRLVQNGEEAFRCMIIRDITSLRASGRAQYQEIPANFTELITEITEEPELEFEIDTDGFFTTANNFALERTGYSFADISRGIHYTDVLAPEERERGKADFGRILQNERIDSLEYSILHKDGTTFPVILSLRQICIDGLIRGVHGVALDITEHKQVEHNLMIREKLNALGEMAGGVVHNFNNILSVILGYLDIIPIEKTDEQHRKVLQGIRQAAQDGTEMVKRIQNFSQKQDTGKREAVDLNAIIREVLEFLRPRFTLADNRITLVTKLGNIPPVLVIDFEMREVLSNIIINALDAMSGKGVLTIRSFLQKAMVSIEITDTGQGMSEETKRHLFEPFYTTKKDHGTGIGMSVSSAIVSKFGGEILVESTEHVGTRITILLPPIEEKSPESSKPEISPEAGPAHRILVLDDEENICEILKEFLSRDGHEVVTAGEGESGLELLKTRDFDILITDLNMPGVSGWDIACRVREQFPDTYIIMLTGWGIQVEQRNRREHIVDRIMNKPIDFSLLSQIVTEVRKI